MVCSQMVCSQKKFHIYFSQKHNMHKYWSASQDFCISFEIVYQKVIMNCRIMGGVLERWCEDTNAGDYKPN